MIRVLLIMLFIINISYAGAERYFIQLGSFKNLKRVERVVNKLPKSLRSHVSIVRYKGWYVPFAYYRKSNKGLSSKVKAYKRYFPDAYVTHGRKMFTHKVFYKFGKREHQVSKRKLFRKKKYTKKRYSKKRYSKKNSIQQSDIQKKIIKQRSVEQTPLQKEKRVEPITLQEVDISMDERMLNIPVQSYSSQNIPSILEALPRVSSLVFPQNEEQRSSLSFTKQMLSGHYYYMTYKDPKGERNLLIKVGFGADSVHYQPLLGDMQMTQARYLVDKGRLYMFAENFSDDGAYSTLDAQKDGYFLVSSWMGNKKLNTLRYYHKLNNAKKYLGVRVSTGLSEVLQDGRFDEFFLNEDEY